MSNIAKFNLQLARYAGPGHWNDPDMLQIGNGTWPIVEQRTHFSLWAIMAAPLLIGTDLRQATSEEMDILRNTDVIACATRGPVSRSWSSTARSPNT